MAKKHLVAGVWILAAALLVPQAAGLSDRLEVTVRVEGSESAAVEEVLRTRFSSPFAHGALLVLIGVPPPVDPRGRAVLRQVVGSLQATGGIKRTFSHLDTSDPLFVPTTGSGTFVVVGLDPGGGSLDRMVPDLRAATAPLEARLRLQFPSAALRWTGQAALNYDLRRATAIARVAEARARGGDESSALVEGLVRAGGTITSAAAIMVAVFAAFMGGDFLLVKMLGFTLAVAVVLDATVMRMALGPALLRVAGRWNWWPGR